MGAKRLLMRKLREILRLKYECGMSHRAIARACGVGVGTVSEYVRRTAKAELSWPLPAELDDGSLEARLFAVVAPHRERVRPDVASMHRELKRPGVTLQLLWEEYLEVYPEGYRYSQYCEIYRRWAKKLKPSMRQVHRAGEKTFVDFSGKRPHIVDRRTGERRPVELFVAALGASSFTYAEATKSQKLPCWVDAHTRMVEYYGGTTEIMVPDQLKSGVSQACRYEPGINRTYQEWAEHYGSVVIPARPGKARDKAKVESAVLVAQRWIVARLRNLTLFSVAEMNQAIWKLLEELNDRPMQKLGVSRRELYERLDKPALRSLPIDRFELAEWKRVHLVDEPLLHVGAVGELELARRRHVRRIRVDRLPLREVDDRAERLRRLEQHAAKPCLAGLRRRGDAGDARPDDDDVVFGRGAGLPRRNAFRERGIAQHRLHGAGAGIG